MSARDELLERLLIAARHSRGDNDLATQFARTLDSGTFVIMFAADYVGDDNADPCPNCGKPLDDDYCAFCGSVVEE